MTKNALVLSGGSVKGCFQAGAIQAVFESGFIPDIIYGASVGSLNGAFMTNFAGKKFLATKQALTTQDWIDIGQQLKNFWFTRIQFPYDVAIQRGLVGDILHIAFNKFEGLSDTSPINNKVDEVIEMKNMLAAPVMLKVGTVDFISSDLKYVTPKDAGFMEALKGSIAIPIAMPPSVSSGKVMFDGGVREVAPMGIAINDENENIIVVCCQSKLLETTGNDFSEKKLLKLIDRLQDIIVNQNVKNDSEWITFLNQVVNETKGMNIPSLASYKIIKHLIIQPEEQLNIDISSFTAKEIRDLWQKGYDTAKKMLGAPMHA
jgi:NTE family protein